jgi:hypothetical protein
LKYNARKPLTTEERLTALATIVRETAWDMQEEVLRGLQRDRGASIVPYLVRCRERPRVIKCIDEGLCSKPGVSLAGAGILLPERELAERCLDLGLAITTHEDCGAARLAAEMARSDLPPMEFAKRWARKMEDQYGVPYVHHFHLKEMDERLPDFHPARMALVGHKPIAVRQGLLAFNCTGPMVGDQDIRIAVEIALGEHGFGEERFAKNRFIVGIVDDPDPEYGFARISNRLWDLLQNHRSLIRLVRIPYPN